MARSFEKITTSVEFNLMLTGEDFEMMIQATLQYTLVCPRCPARENFRRHQVPSFAKSALIEIIKITNLRQKDKEGKT